MRRSLRLAIIGASARAAAFSALDAGHDVVAADLFADADLATRCPATRITNWPDGFSLWLSIQEVDGWLYTGGLENYPALVDPLACLRPLWGNSGEALNVARSPSALAPILAKAGCPFPETRITAEILDGDWLVKSLTSSGGLGVAEWTSNEAVDGETYFQKRITGQSISAAYVAARGQAILLGVTEQLIGRDWTRAAKFQYAGSIGPFDLEPPTLAVVRRSGEVLASDCGLQGLFGVDFVVDSGGLPWLVDVNPRYTASMEIVEQMTGRSMIDTHLAAYRSDRLPDSLGRRDGVYYGKAYLFARENVTVGELTACGLADVPAPGTVIAKQAPIATLFAEASSPCEVETLLQQRVRCLEDRVFS